MPLKTRVLLLSSHLLYTNLLGVSSSLDPILPNRRRSFLPKNHEQLFNNLRSIVVLRGGASFQDGDDDEEDKAKWDAMVELLLQSVESDAETKANEIQRNVGGEPIQDDDNGETKIEREDRDKENHTMIEEVQKAQVEKTEDISKPIKLARETRTIKASKMQKIETVSKGSEKPTSLPKNISAKKIPHDQKKSRLKKKLTKARADEAAVVVDNPVENNKNKNSKASVDSFTDEEKDLVKIAIKTKDELSVTKPKKEKVKSKSKLVQPDLVTTMDKEASDVEISPPSKEPIFNNSDMSHANSEKETQLPPPPPHALYRFLLRRGRVGHIIVMTLIICFEWIRMYIPTLYNLLFECLLKLRIIADPEEVRWKQRKLAERQKRLDIAANAESAGMVSDQRGLGSKKARKAKAEREDALALAKLKQLGTDISVAKYRHLSNDFMKRHGLGVYASADQDKNALLDREEDGEEKQEDEKTLMEHSSGRKIKRKKKLASVSTGDGDSDNGEWILEAFNVHDDADENVPESMFSIGFDTLPFGSKEKQKVTVLMAAQQAVRPYEIRVKKPSLEAPRVSDRDGGGGVLGRIRAATSDSHLSRQLMGAYPGDAPPIEEAADPKGVLLLAQRYGYGEWSDDEDESTPDFFGETGPPKHVSRKKRVKKNRQANLPSSGSNGGLNFSVQVGLGSKPTPIKSPLTKRLDKESETKKIKKRRKKALIDKISQKNHAGVLISPIGKSLRTRHQSEKTWSKKENPSSAHSFQPPLSERPMNTIPTSVVRRPISKSIREAREASEKKEKTE